MIPLFTSSWSAVWRMAKSSTPLAFAPVRASLGVPKFWPDAEHLPYVRELAPAGLFHLVGDEFADRYVARLDTIGADAIGARLAEVYAQERKPLALLCFEDVHAGQLCHRRLWASWWQERTGQTVPELEPPREVAPGATSLSSNQLTLDTAA